MTFEIYAACVVPINAFFTSSLWFGNTAYLRISVAFIQMLKARMPVATFLMVVICGIFTEALRLVLTQFLLQKKGLNLNPIISLYYIAPCSFLFLFVPWYLLEQPTMEVQQLQLNFWIFFSNALCALALNFSIFLVIGRARAITVRVVGVLKDWILIVLSTVVFPESAIIGLNIIGYAIALCGVVMSNYLKVKDGWATNQLPIDVATEKSKASIKS